MKKLIVSMMLATALLAGGSIYAQNQTQGNTGATTQKGQKEWTKGEKKGDKKGGKKMGKEGNKAKFNPFDGIQLTDDQQQRLQVLRQGLGPVQLTPEQQAKIKENPNLTPEQKKQLKEERKAQKLQQKKNYLNGVKEVLTPEQYVVFLENVYLYAPEKKSKAEMGFKGGKNSKQGKKGDRGGKPQKGQKSEQPAQSK